MDIQYSEFAKIQDVFNAHCFITKHGQQKCRELFASQQLHEEHKILI